MRAVLLIGVARALPAQSVADRIAAVSDGTVQFRFAARPGVCGDGEGTIAFGNSMFRSEVGSWNTRGSHWRESCAPGPVQVRLTIREHEVIALRTTVGDARSTPPGVRDLGVVPAVDAADYLVTLAARDDRRANQQALLPALLADSAVIWPRLVRLARDSTRSRRMRQEATQWLAQLASGAFGETRDTEETDEQHVRGQAIFALSQLPRDESVPALIDVARRNADPLLRRRALFWLGQSLDPRAIDVIEETLRAQARR
jgi:hypothetical protein